MYSSTAPSGPGTSETVGQVYRAVLENRRGKLVLVVRKP